jgi:hypothetical protein
VDNGKRYQCYSQHEWNQHQYAFCQLIEHCFILEKLFSIKRLLLDFFGIRFCFPFGKMAVRIYASMHFILFHTILQKKQRAAGGLPFVETIFFPLKNVVNLHFEMFSAKRRHLTQAVDNGG